MLWEITSMENTFRVKVAQPVMTTRLVYWTKKSVRYLGCVISDI